MKRLALKVCLTLSGALIVAFSCASAQLPITPAYEYESASHVFIDDPGTFQAPGWTLGFKFFLFAPATEINALGYDAYALASEYCDCRRNRQIGFWNSEGILLASTTISDRNTLQGHFYWTSIPTLVLPRGSYTIGGTYYTVVGIDRNVSEIPLYPFPVRPLPGYYWTGWRIDKNHGLSFPVETPRGSENTYGRNGIALVNFSMVSHQREVPEPATWGMLLLGFGAIGGLLRARRRQNVSISYG